MNTKSERVLAVPLWGEASERRGLTHLNEALTFVKKYPVGTRISVDDFDIWAHSEDLLTLPLGCARTDDAWKAHVIKRNEVRSQINASGAHPRLLQNGSTPFVIDWLGGDMYIVSSPEQSAAVGAAYPKIIRRLEGILNELKVRYQAADFATLLPHDKATAEFHFEDMSDICDGFSAQIEYKIRRIERYKDRVRFLVEERERADRKLLLPSSDDSETDA